MTSVAPGLQNITGSAIGNSVAPIQGLGSNLNNPINGYAQPSTQTATPVSLSTPSAQASYYSSTPGFNGNPSGQPSFLGTGEFVAQPYAISDNAITGDPSQGATSNYGLNDVWSSLAGALQGNQVQNYNATAPQSAAAQMQGAYANAAQAQAAQMQGAQMQGAYLGGPSQSNAAAMQAAQMGAAYLGGPAQAGAAQAQGAQISTAGDADVMAQQNQLANILGTQAAGGGVSPADLQLAQGAQSNLAGQLSVLGSQRGGAANSAALTERAALDQGAAANANLNQQMGIQRAQETLNAQNSLGTVLGTERGQSQAYNLSAAQLGQNSNQFNAGLAQSTNQANQAAINQYGLANQQAAMAANTSNLGATNAASLANMQALQNTGQVNQAAINQFGLANQQAAMTTNQQNLGSLNAASAANLAANQQTNQLNQGALNQQTLANQASANAANTSNLGALQQTNLANLSQQGQYGLANQQAAITAQNQYYQNLIGITGAQAGVAQSNRAAQLANQQLQVQQQTGINQVNAEGYTAAAQANANLTGTIASALGGVGAAGVNALGQSVGGASLANPGTAGTLGSADNPAATQVTTGGFGDPLAIGDVPSYANSYTVSDENMKEGVEGGNPMLQSFLSQYRDAGGDQSDQVGNVESGLNFRTQQYGAKTGGTAGSSGGGSTGATIGGVAGGVLGAILTGVTFGAAAPAVPALAALGSAAGGAIGNATDPAKAGSGGISQETQQAGGFQQIGVDEGGDTDLGQALSDEDAKEEAAVHGGKAVQAVLQDVANQAPASGYGAQLPPWQSAPSTPRGAQGYGAPVAQGVSMGGVSEGGQLASTGGIYGGGYGGGGWTAGGGLSTGGVYGGGVTSGGVTAGAPMSYGGITQQGGINQGFTNTTPQNARPAAGLGNAPSLAAAGIAGGPNTINYQNLPPPPYMGPGAQINPANNSVNLPALQAAGIAAGPASLTPPGAAINPANSNTFLPALSSAGVAGGPSTVAPQPVYSPIITGGAQGAQGSFLSALSDENQKDEVQGFLDSVHAHQYRYKNPDAPGAGHGTFISPMAQEIESTPLGAPAVSRGQDGYKRVDYGKLGGVMLAGQAMLNERLNEHEKMLQSMGHG